MFGDDYFCELDLIEIVERNKEGYESDVTDIEEDINDEETEENGAKSNGFMNGHTDNLTNGVATISMNGEAKQPVNGDDNQPMNDNTDNTTNDSGNNASNGPNGLHINGTNNGAPMNGDIIEPINGDANGSSKRNGDLSLDSCEEEVPKKKFKSIRKHYPEDGRQGCYSSHLYYDYKINNRIYQKALIL